MPKFVIERDILGAGKLPKQELQAISQKSCSVLQSMGPRIQWVQSFVTDDKIYCVYIAPDEATVKAHAQKGGFPANVVARVRSVIDPTTAEAA
jgi:Nickel responsive protein SCO4226-like